jgi:hypothetical protein
MAPVRTILFCAILLTLAGCGVATPIPSVPDGAPPPSADQAPIVGVAYRITFQCPIPLPLGSTWWDFDNPEPWPAQLPGNVIYSTWDVPGIITLLSADAARFRADVDGSELSMTRLETQPTPADLTCSGV